MIALWQGALVLGCCSLPALANKSGNLSDSDTVTPGACIAQAPQHISSVTVATLCNATSAGEGNNVKATAPLHAVARGLQSAGDTRRMRRFVSQVLHGNNATISVAGGSISRGYSDTMDIEWRSQGHAAAGGAACCRLHVNL